MGPFKNKSEEEFFYNPFRILRLSINSSSEEIERRKKSLKDIKYLDDFSQNDFIRYHNKIELNNVTIRSLNSKFIKPEHRIFYRILWFEIDNVYFENYEVDDILDINNDNYFYYDNDIIRKHNIGTAKLYIILSLFKNNFNKNYSLNEIYDEFEHYRKKYKLDSFLEDWDILAAKEFENYLKNLENDSDYRTKVTSNDVTLAIEEAKHLISDLVYNIIISNLIDLNDNKLIYYFIDLIYNSKFTNILDKMEEFLEENITENCKDLNDKLNEVINENFVSINASNKLKDLYNKYTNIKNKISIMSELIDDEEDIEQIKLENNYYDIMINLSIKGFSVQENDINKMISIIREELPINNSNVRDKILYELFIDINEKIAKYLEVIDELKNNPNKSNILEILYKIEKDINIYFYKEMSLIYDIDVEKECFYKCNAALSLLLNNLALAFHHNLNDRDKIIQLLQQAYQLEHQDYKRKKLIQENINFINNYNLYKSKENNLLKSKRQQGLIIIGIVILLLIIIPSFADNQSKDNSINNTNQTKSTVNNNSPNELKKVIDKNIETLNKMEKEIEDLNNNLDSIKTELNYYKDEIDDFEDKISLNLYINQYEYESTIDTYNDYVDEYNSLFNEYNSKYSKYKKLLDETNSLIAKYNKKLGGN